MKKKLLKILAVFLMLLMMGGNMYLTARRCSAEDDCGAKCEITGSSVTCTAHDGCATCSNDTTTIVKCCV